MQLRLTTSLLLCGVCQTKRGGKSRHEVFESILRFVDDVGIVWIPLPVQSTKKAFLKEASTGTKRETRAPELPDSRRADSRVRDETSEKELRRTCASCALEYSRCLPLLASSPPGQPGHCLHLYPFAFYSPSCTLVPLISRLVSHSAFCPFAFCAFCPFAFALVSAFFFPPHFLSSSLI